jgi:hypothetical protein
MVDGICPSIAMTTVVTSPPSSGTRPPERERRLPGFGPLGRRRRAAIGGVAVGLLAVASLLVTNDLRGRAEIRSDSASLMSTNRQLGHLRGQLAVIERRLATVRSGRQMATRSFDAVQSTLSATQATLSRDQAGIHSEGLDLGALDTCVSDVEQALNQFAVGQTSGGVLSLRASSTACSALEGAG